MVSKKYHTMSTLHNCVMGNEIYMGNMTLFDGIKWVATTLDGKTIELPDNNTLIILLNTQADSILKVDRILKDHHSIC